MRNLSNFFPFAALWHISAFLFVPDSNMRQPPFLCCETSIAKVNSGRSAPKAEVTLANPQVEVTLTNFTPLILFML